MSGHILIVGDVANMLGVSAQTLDSACEGARVSRTVLRSEILRALRGEPLDVIVTASAAPLLAGTDFLAAFAARSGPVVLLVAVHPPATAPTVDGVRVLYVPPPTDAAALRGHVEAALRAARAAAPTLRPPEPAADVAADVAAEMAPAVAPHSALEPAADPTIPIETAAHDPPGRGLAADVTTIGPVKRGDEQMANISKTLEEAMKIDGAIGVALADWDSGLCLGTAGGGSRLNVEVAAAGNCQVVKAKMATMNELGIKGAIHDILITLDDQVHLIRPLRRDESLFLYVAIDKVKGNLGLARHRVQKLESELSI